MSAMHRTTADLGRTDPEHELRSRRIVHAPRDEVYRAMTELEHLERWWGPAGFSTSTEEFDPRPGGRWRLTLHAPDGRDFGNQIVFDSLERPSRIVYRHVPSPGTEPVEFEVTVDLSAYGNDTEVSVTFRFATPELRRHVVETYRADVGNWQTLNRLESHLHSARHPLTLVVDPESPQFRTVRDLAAPVERVWEALTDPAQIARWWGAVGVHGKTEVRSYDFRVGGEWRFAEKTAQGEEVPFRGVFREISPPTRLALTHRSEHDDWPGGEMLVTCVLTEHEGGTRLTTSWGFASMEGRQPWIDAGFGPGVREHFNRLADFVANPWEGP